MKNLQNKWTCNINELLYIFIMYVLVMLWKSLIDLYLDSTALNSSHKMYLTTIIPNLQITTFVPLTYFSTYPKYLHKLSLKYIFRTIFDLKCSNIVWASLIISVALLTDLSWSCERRLLISSLCCFVSWK